MKLKEKFDNQLHLISTIAGTITGYPEDVQETFSRLLTDKYLDAADKVLYTRYGDRILRSEDDIIISIEVVSYLIMHAPYYKKCLEYIDAEYNPIENYSSSEHETFKNEYDSVMNHGLNTKGQDVIQHGAHTDQHVYPQYTDTYTEGLGGYNVTEHIAKIKTSTTPGTDTSTTKTAPFESSDFFNKDQTTVSHTMGTETVERVETGDDGGDDKTSYSQKTNSDQHGAHTDQIVNSQYSDTYHLGGASDTFTDVTDKRTDNVTRDLSRSGNIGVMTAAQMMSDDRDFWKSFGWLQDLAHDIANLLTLGVWAV